MNQYDNVKIENSTTITHSLLHDIKDMAIELENVKLKVQILEDKINNICTCVICNGFSKDKESSLCDRCRQLMYG